MIDIDDERNVVLTFGKPIPDKLLNAYRERRLTPQTTIEPFKRIAKASLFYFNPYKPGQFKDYLIGTAKELSDLGAEHVFFADDALSSNQMASIIGDCSRAYKKAKIPSYLLVEPTNIAGIANQAERIARVPRRPILNNGAIEFSGEKVSNGTQLFLRRAFSDGKRLALFSLGGGFSASVFRLHADLNGGGRPLPFFAKIDDRIKINIEIDNYASYVANYIPFNMRPNLDHARCCVGAEKGLLAGNFVAHADPLLSVAMRGQAQPAIYALFDNALRGWRANYTTSSSSMTSSCFQKTDLWNGFEDYRIPRDTELRARRFGSRLSPAELNKKIIDLSSISHRTGIIHGDLHGTNVLVRNNDPILIDFFSTRNGPLIADAASLEVSLAFNEKAIPLGGFTRWRWHIDNLFRTFKASPAPLINPSRFEWLWTIIRQIRLLNLCYIECEEEYRVGLAMFLFRYASFPTNGLSLNGKKASAYALVMAERLLRQIGN